ncbi:MAG: glycosyltransferase family 39 protein [Anaerolineae bacterium]|nr:glycosyltransferase family 39 protein [Anaerolineae bacterium]
MPIQIPQLKKVRPLLGWLAALGAVLFMANAGYNFRWIMGQRIDLDTPYTAINSLLLGAALLWIAVRLLKPPLESFGSLAETVTETPVKWRIVSGGAASLLLLTILTNHPTLKFLPISQHIQMAFFTGGILAAAWGLGGFRGLRIQKSWAVAVLIIIMLIGLILRLWHLNDALHIMIDEVHFHFGIIDLWNQSTIRLIAPMNGIAAFPHLYSYLQQWTVALFGADLAGPRMTSVIVGVLTIPALYALANVLFDRRTALIAAAVLAIFPPHIHFSRLALNNIADPLTGTLALACLVNALRRGASRDYVLAGILLGLTSYFYEAGRLVFLGLFIVWGGVLLLTYRPRAHRRGWLLMGLAALLVAFPYYATMLNTDLSIAPRLTSEGIRPYYLLRDLGLEPPLEVLQRHYHEAIKPALFHTVWSPDGSRFYYGGYTGIIPWYIVPFFLLGLFYAFWRMRSAGALLWLWVAMTLFGVSLVVSTNWTARFVVLFPVMALLIAVGLRYPLDMLAPRWLPVWSRMLIIAGLLLAMGTGTIIWYFNEHLPAVNNQIRVNYDYFDAIDRATYYPKGAEAIFVTNQLIHTPVLDATISLRRLKLPYTILYQEELLLPRVSALPRDHILLFFLEQDDAISYALIARIFPLQGPFFSRYTSVPHERQYALWVYTPPG